MVLAMRSAAGEDTAKSFGTNEVAGLKVLADGTARTLEQHRLELGLSCPEMAVLIGVSHPTYLHHERNPELGFEPRTLALFRNVLGDDFGDKRATAHEPPRSPTMASLEALRAAKALPYQTMARELGIDRRSYRMLMHGRAMMSFRTCRLAGRILHSEMNETAAALKIAEDEGLFKVDSALGRAIVTLLSAASKTPEEMADESRKRACLTVTGASRPRGGARNATGTIVSSSAAGRTAVVWRAIQTANWVPKRPTIYEWAETLLEWGVDPAPLYKAFAEALQSAPSSHEARERGSRWVRESFESATEQYDIDDVRMDWRERGLKLLPEARVRGAGRGQVPERRCCRRCPGCPAETALEARCFDRPNACGSGWSPAN
jgi:DNA-binding XRE family transcriptional regulator